MTGPSVGPKHQQKACACGNRERGGGWNGCGSACENIRSGAARTPDCPLRGIDETCVARAGRTGRAGGCATGGKHCWNANRSGYAPRPRLYRPGVVVVVFPSEIQGLWWVNFSQPSPQKTDNQILATPAEHDDPLACLCLYMGTTDSPIFLYRPMRGADGACDARVDRIGCARDCATRGKKRWREQPD